jgi:hypothetical protein
MSWVQELTELDELKKLGELSSSHFPFQVDDVCINFLHLGWKNFAATGERITPKKLEVLLNRFEYVSLTPAGLCPYLQCHRLTIVNDNTTRHLCHPHLVLIKILK